MYNKEPSHLEQLLCNHTVLGFQDFEEAEQQAKERRVADAELAASQVLQLLLHAHLPDTAAEPLMH